MTKEECTQYRELDINGYSYLSSSLEDKSLELICEEDKEEDDDVGNYFATMLSKFD